MTEGEQLIKRMKIGSDYHKATGKYQKIGKAINHRLQLSYFQNCN